MIEDAFLSYNYISTILFLIGVFLETYREQTEWKRDLKWKQIVYVGDGSADYCASLSLHPGEHVLARTGYSLHKRLIKDGGERFVGIMDEWRDGHDVEKILSRILKLPTTSVDDDGVAVTI